jgi:hypothetical protein
VQQAEGRYGSYTLVEGEPFVISSVIRLQNSDEALSSLDFKGYRVYIEWGFNTASGNRTSRSGPEFVISQELVSYYGLSYLELFTVSLWELANQIYLNVGNIVPQFWTKGGASETKVSHILMQLLGGGELDAVIRDNGGVFTDYTAEAKSVALGDVSLYPPTPAIDDAIYFGKTLKFDRLSIDIHTILSSGSMTILWEYSIGSGTWGTLAVLTASDGGQATSHLDLMASTGIFIEAFDMPSDWATDTINSQGPYFYIRARVTAVSSPSGTTFASLVFGGQDFAFQLDTTESTQGDDYLPTYATATQSQLGTVVEDILSYTLLGVRLQEDGFHAAFVDNAQASPDETYNLSSGPHTFFTHQENQGVVIPNRVLVVSGDLGSGPAAFSGLSNETGSQGEIGIIPRIDIQREVTSDADAATRAGVVIAQLQRDVLQGRIEVPLHAGQEIWDEVRVVDARTGRTVDGRVTQLVRLYTPGQYVMQVIMGGTVYAIGIVAPFEFLDLAEVAPRVGSLTPPEAVFRPFADRMRVRPTLAPAPTPGEPFPLPRPTPRIAPSIETVPGLPLPATFAPGRVTEQRIQIEELRAMGLSNEEILKELNGPLARSRRARLLGQ